MIKRLIFDLDDTLIMWKDNYSTYLANLLDKFDKTYDEDYLIKMENIIDNYRDDQFILTKEKLLSAINLGMNENYSFEFIKMLVDGVSECSEIASDELINTLEYLSSKYDLVVLSNWFEEGQRKRLEIAGIDKYFIKIYGAPYCLLKPNPDGFIKAMDNTKPSECIMIGDDIICDIEGAISAGIDAIYCNFKNKNIKYDGKTILKIEELKELL